MNNHSLYGLRNIYRYNFAAIMLVVSVFSRELGLGSLFGIDFDWISYPFYILYFLGLLITLRLSFDRFIAIFILFLSISSILAKVYMGLSFSPFIKQIAPILLIYTITAHVLRREGIRKVFLLYVDIATIAAIIGFIQFALKFVDIRFLTDYSWYNIDSIAEEPSHYNVIIMPALVYTYIYRKKYFVSFMLLLMSMILTFNLTGYLIFGLMVLFLNIKSWYAILTIPIICTLAVFVYKNDPEIQFRVNGMFEYTETLDLSDTHGTPLSFFSNLQVAFYNVIRNPLFGSGLGGHEETYYRYFSFATFSKLDYLFGLNARSAHSLSIRVLSELGILGFALYSYTLTRILFLKRDGSLYPIGLACLSHFLCKSLKLGNYFDLGTPLFFLICIYVFSKSKK